MRIDRVAAAAVGVGSQRPLPPLLRQAHAKRVNKKPVLIVSDHPIGKHKAQLSGGIYTISLPVS